MVENKDMFSGVKTIVRYRASLLFFGLFTVMMASMIHAGQADGKRGGAGGSRSEAVIFCLHDIGGKGKYSLTEEEFSAVLELLRDRYRVISLADWLASRASDEDLRPVVVLTFDDGYPSIFDKVIPVLQEYGYGATFYVYLDRYPDASSVYRKLRNLPDQFEIGSHSNSHVAMDELHETNRNRFYRELFLSRKKLEYLVGRRIKSFAWPYGRYHADLVPYVQMAGYETQVSTDYSVASSEQEIFSRFTVQKPAPVEQVKEILAKTARR